MRRITVKKATELEGIVSDIAENASSLQDAIANLQDEDVRGSERNDDNDNVESAFNDLCSNVRVLARELGLTADLEPAVTVKAKS